jgi:putative toxin-antitoxin system antitoxin component (TIGR02293 family)
MARYLCHLANVNKCRMSIVQEVVRPAGAVPSAIGGTFYSQVFSLLGRRGRHFRSVTSHQEVHELLQRGLPAAAVVSFSEQCASLPIEDVLDLIGISKRTYARRMEHPEVSLSTVESNNLWKIASLLTKAGEVLGGREAAERWFMQPALALNKQRPLDLAKTEAGAELVRDLLLRMEFGVYA